MKAIDSNIFSQLMSLNEKELNNFNAKWVTADAKPGYPCRVSLKEADVGERVLLVYFKHHDVDSPYRASGPIFVRENVKKSELEINEIPEILTQRLLSIRAYNHKHLMVHAETLQGAVLEHVIRKQFLSNEVAYIQIHNANPGCFNCNVYRA